jgi:acetyl-CoA acetyltransferase
MIILLLPCIPYLEAMGICQPGQAVHLLKEAAFDIGGRCAVNTSGGLIAMGHPIGPTGIGQIGELARQLRGEAGPRQHRGAKIGLAHMVGVGAVCYVHTLQRDSRWHLQFCTSVTGCGLTNVVYGDFSCSPDE